VGEQVDFKTASLHIRRAKNGTPATHPLSGREMRELRRHQRESPSSPFVFVSERGAPLSAPGFSRMVERAATEAGLGHQGTCPHAASRLRLQACQRRSRYAGDPSLSWASQHSEYDALYDLGAAAVQGVFSGLTRPRYTPGRSKGRRGGMLERVLTPAPPGATETLLQR
jgi:hypothetical protein